MPPTALHRDEDTFSLTKQGTSGYRWEPDLLSAQSSVGVLAPVLLHHEET